eukprot:CAMPEP_0170491876 /NCGR_PEP_ID=MMETSP0208-20121228/11305_1 /TAXON_ID=197538 /ORGANISM="Strombidium inclinatum, Strain S3" /LENGTH=170 /DNA_ID=CAMNT_0010767521 /DNA_START=546 /DNA_END=1058 /DNA_ORIENTATION=+
MTGVISMLSYATLFSILNLFLEELNHWGKYGDFLSSALAPVSFVGNIFFGFWVLAKRGKFSSTKLIVGMALLYFGCVVLKPLIKKCRGQYFYLNWTQAIGALVSILIACFCQEDILPGRPCHPTSVFQYHAVWHTLAALSLCLTMIIMRSEKELNLTSGYASKEGCLWSP